MANKNIKDSIANIIPPKPSNDKSYGGVPAGWMPSTQYDESDDLEAAKRLEPTESEIMQEELEPLWANEKLETKQEQVLKGPDKIKELARKQRGLQTD